MRKKIKSVTMFKYDIVLKDVTAKELEESGYKYAYSEFDKNENKISEIRYAIEGETEEKYINKFDENGYLYEEMNYISDDELAEHKTYERDKKGNVVNAFKHYQDGDKDTIKYLRDESGKLLEKITIDSFNEEEAREVIEYKNDKVSSRKIFEYDELVLEESYDYNDNGNMIEHNKWSIEQEDAKFLTIYNPNGTIKKALRHNSKDELISKAEYTYNEDRLTCIEEESQYGKNKTVIEYDEGGNPIVQTERNNKNEINNIAKRKYNENNDITETEVFIDFHGRGINQKYLLKYSYEYF
ncbi:MAG: hypothetical protein K8S16_18385 [Bacteroidales bacterium]|nr:hypothetical protein [Bacteroidales bacterium]